MNHDTAKEITTMWFYGTRKFEAIKLLRQESALGLKEAKDYLHEHGRHVDHLLKQLGKDFIKDPRELLIEARAQLRRQLSYIEELQRAAGEETVSDELMAAIMDPRPTKLSDLIVVDILYHGESLFADGLNESPGEHIVIDILSGVPLGLIATHRVVLSPELEAAEELITERMGFE